MYKSKLLNKFYEALFYTDFNDCESATQNAKTDYLCDIARDERLDEVTFEEWFDEVLNTFVYEFGVDKQEVLNEIKKDPKFLEDLKSEFEYLLEEFKEMY